MTIERYFLDSDFVENTEVIIEGPEFLHMIKVMRKQLKDTVELINGRGKLARARICLLEKVRIILNIEEVFFDKANHVKIIIAQAITRSNKLDVILEKSTELGMSAIWFFPGEYGEKKTLSSNCLQRMHRIAISATKQCGRLYVPDIVLKPSISEWDYLEYNSFFGDTCKKAPRFMNVWPKYSTKDSLFFIGPEKGFSYEEISHMRQLGAKGVKLNNNILRTDTAPLVALSIMGA